MLGTRPLATTAIATRPISDLFGGCVHVVITAAVAVVSLSNAFSTIVKTAARAIVQILNCAKDE